MIITYPQTITPYVKELRHLCLGHHREREAGPEKAEGGATNKDSAFLVTPYTCRNGHTIHYSFLCDGKDDCGDRSDESSCIRSKKRLFVCTNNQTTSIFNWCDGKRDCFDGSDEKEKAGLECKKRHKMAQ